MGTQGWFHGVIPSVDTLGRHLGRTVPTLADLFEALGTALLRAFGRAFGAQSFGAQSFGRASVCARPGLQGARWRDFVDTLPQRDGECAEHAGRGPGPRWRGCCAETTRGGGAEEGARPEKVSAGRVRREEGGGFVLGVKVGRARAPYHALALAHAAGHERCLAAQNRRQEN